MGTKSRFFLIMCAALLNVSLVRSQVDRVVANNTTDGLLFYESFNQCEGTGGNDGMWSGQIAGDTFVPDNDGWSAEKAYGADQCAKFGISSIAGSATTPAFTLDGTGVLTFRAGAWNAKNDGTTLKLSLSNGIVSPQTVTIPKGAFSEFTATITATGSVRLTFESDNGRFFLDEVLVKETNDVTEPVEDKEAYVVRTENTLTFYYDNLRYTRQGTKYSLNTGSDFPEWIGSWNNNTNWKITKVVFTPSFADARPTSTAYWFYFGIYPSTSNLSIIEGIEYLNTSNVTCMRGMFYGSGELTNLDLSHFDTSNVTDMSKMFELCRELPNLDVSNFVTSNVTDMSSMFSGCNGLTSLSVSNFDTSNVTNMSSMFSGCNGLTSLSVSNFNTSNVTDMNHLFSRCEKFTTLDISNFNTSNVTDMSYMFMSCKSLIALSVSNFNTINVTDMNHMFSGCNGLTTLSVSNFNTGNVTDMSYMFNGCNSLTSLIVSNFNTSNVTDMSHMFLGCKSLTVLDLGNFDTSNVTNMNAMFWYCKGLTSLNVSSFNTAKVTNMEEMFGLCNSLTDLDVSHFDTGNVTNMEWMFKECNSLITLDLSNFKTSNVTDMREMFVNCKSLMVLDLGNFDTSNVTNMNSMFTGCNRLSTLDLSTFNTSCVTEMVGMFYKCDGITTIYAGTEWNVDNVTKSSGMFSNCYKLVGGAGTVYNESHTTVSYAHVDGGPSNPGYLTFKEASVVISDADDLQDFINGLGDNKGTEGDPVIVPVGDDGLTIDGNVDVNDDLQLFIDGGSDGESFLPIRYAGGFICIFTNCSFAFNHVAMVGTPSMPSGSSGGIKNSGKLKLTNSTVTDGVIVNSGGLYIDGNVSIGGMQHKHGGRMYVTSSLSNDVNISIADVADLELYTPIILGGDGYLLSFSDTDHVHLSLPEGYEWKYDIASRSIVIIIASGISQISNEQPTVVGTYDATGRSIDAKSKGLHIQRMSDGTVRKHF